MRPVLAGPLRHRIELEVAAELRDEYGDTILDWSTAARRWASVEPLRGEERLEAAQVHGQVTHRVVIRGQVEPRPTPRDRVRFRGRTLRVEAVIDVEERGRALELLVREEV